MIAFINLFSNFHPELGALALMFATWEMERRI
jgi:hypothetical protein